MSTRDMPGRRTSTPDLETIIDTAAHLFHRRGYQNTTMQELADELGIAKPTLYAHVRSKIFILGRIFDRVLDEAQQMVTSACEQDDPLEGVRMLILGQTRLSLMYRDYYSVFFGDQRELPEPLGRRYRSWSARYVESVRELVTRGQDAGVIRADIDALVAAHSIIGMTSWAARWLRPKGRLSAETTAKQFITLILDGIAAPEPRGAPTDQP